jgi:hypothetical protein
MENKRGNRSGVTRAPGGEYLLPALELIRVSSENGR